MENQPASHRLRLGRHSEGNRVYLVTTTTKDRQPVFRDFHCSRLLIRCMQQLQARGHVQSLAFVVMPDHLHWLFSLYPGYRLEGVMHRLKGRVASAVNRHRGAREPFWQQGYHDHALRRDEDLRVVARYVVMNPVRAGLVRSVREYPHWDAIWLP